MALVRPQKGTFCKSIRRLLEAKRAYVRFELYENSLQIAFDKGTSCLLKQLSYLFVFCFMHGINLMYSISFIYKNQSQ